MDASGSSAPLRTCEARSSHPQAEMSAIGVGIVHDVRPPFEMIVKDL